VTLLQFLAFSGLFVSTALAFTGGMQGAGDTMTPMVIAILSQIVILLGLCQIFAVLDMLTATTIWASILVSHLSRLAMSFAAFQSGRWRRMRVHLEYAATPLEADEIVPDATPEPRTVANQP
jgi:Na+-driven multidrug efflux pump